MDLKSVIRFLHAGEEGEMVMVMVMGSGKFWVFEWFLILIPFIAVRHGHDQGVSNSGKVLAGRPSATFEYETTYAYY